MDDRRWAVAEGRGPFAATDAGRSELRDERILRIAPAGARPAMQDGRLACGEGEVEVPSQIRELFGDRAEAPVIVEPGLADRDAPRVGRPSDDPVPAVRHDLGRVVGVD